MTSDPASAMQHPGSRDTAAHRSAATSNLGAPPAPSQRRERVPVLLLQIYSFTLLAIPSNATLAPVGAAGFPAGILGLVIFALYVTWVFAGSHNPWKDRYPSRLAFLAIWITSLLSYIALQLRDHTAIEGNGADRWLLFLASITGVAWLAAECLDTRQRMLSVLRALTWGGAVSGGVAILQFSAGIDLSATIGQALPGFSYDAALGGIQNRGALSRVPGTSLHPIELGTVASMLLPLAVILFLTDTSRAIWRRVLPLTLIAACIPVSVSRSAILGTAVMLILFVPQLDARRRAVSMGLVPIAGLLAFFSFPGLLTTLSSFLINAGTDTSIATRTDDYPLVERLVRQRPLFGLGGGTYLPQDLLDSIRQRVPQVGR